MLTKLGIPSFNISALFNRNGANTPEKTPADNQPFIAYPFAGADTKKGLPNDLELNDYATHQQGVLVPAIKKAMQRISQRQAFMAMLQKKMPDQAAALGIGKGKTDISFQAFDYVNVYQKGVKNLKEKLDKAGFKIPERITWGVRTFAEDEHVKNNVTTKYNNRKIRDDDPTLEGIGFRHRFTSANKEKKLIIYKNIRQFASHRMMAQVKALSTLFGVDANGKDVALTALPANSVKGINAWVKEHFGITPQKSLTKATQRELDLELAKRPPNMMAINAILHRYFNLVIDKAPFGGEIRALAEKFKQEELNQTRHAQKNVGEFGLEDGSVCKKLSDTEFMLARPYGKEKIELRFTRQDAGAAFALELHKIDGEGNRTHVALDDQGQDAWGTLKQYFDKTSVLKTLFGNGDGLRKTGFDALYGHLVANEMIEQKITDFVNAPIKEVLDQRLKNCVTFHGTGFSYNAAHYGENLGIECRGVVMGLIHKKAMNGDLAINGSCGFQQDLLWHNGGHIIAIQDITGKTFLDSEHGNDPYTVEEKTTWQSIKPDTLTAGVYETKTAQGRWQPRDVAPLSVPLRTKRDDVDEGGNAIVTVEERPLFITHRGNPVPASAALALREAKDAAGNPIELDAIANRADVDTLVFKHELEEGSALADDEGKLVRDENGDPVRLLESVVVKRKAMDGAARTDASGNPVLASEDFEIAAIERWIRMPLSDGKGGVKTGRQGEVLCTYKKEVQDTNPNPEILRDRQFSTINCVHTQNGLDVAHARLTPGVEIVAHSVKPDDGVFDRSFISAASKANPVPHPVHVPENTPQQSMIVEAMEIQKGNRTIGRTTQHHIDMLKEEGGTKMNPYYAGRYEEQPDEEYIGHREGNAESVETGIFVQQTKEMFAELKQVAASPEMRFGSEDPGERRDTLIQPGKVKEGAQANNGTKRNDALPDSYSEGPRKLIYDLFVGSDREQAASQLRALLDEGGVTQDPELEAEIRQALKTWEKMPTRGPAQSGETSGVSHARNVRDIRSLDMSDDGTISGQDGIEADEQMQERAKALQSAFDGSDPMLQAASIASIEYLVNSGYVDHWVDVEGKAAKARELSRIIASPEVRELHALLQEIQASHGDIESMNAGLNTVRDTLANAMETGEKIPRTELQRYFRSYPGWSIPLGPKAGAAGDSPIENIFHPIAEGSAQGLAGLGAATGAFGPLLIAMGIEQGKNAAIALRRLKEMKQPYENYRKELQEQREALDKFGTDLLQGLSSGDESRQALLAEAIADLYARIESTQSTTTSRLKVINQQIEDQVFNAFTSPLLPLDGAAVITHSIAASLHAGAIAAGAATAGSAALAALGLANLVKTVWEHNKIRKLDKKITRLNLGEDSGLRLNFNTFEQNKKMALKFQMGNWSVFTGSSGLLIAAPFTGPAAIPLGVTAGVGLAVSTVLAFILPKREWRGRTMRAGENTTHINSDFLSTERRMNRLSANLFNQLGMQQNIFQKIVDRDIDGANKFDDPAWKQFRYRFEKARSLRWVYTDADRKILSKAISEHPAETRDSQFDLMLRSTDHEINYMTFQVNERRQDVATRGASIAQLKQVAQAESLPVAAVLESGLKKMSDELEREETRLRSLIDLRTRLRDFEEHQNKDWAPETQATFDELRLRYMVAHDMLVDAMSRDEIRELVQAHEDAGPAARVLTARYGDHTYDGRNNQIIGEKEELKNVEFQYGDKTFAFLLDKMDRINARFAHMMCYSIPDKLSYEVNALMNLYEEDLKQRVKDMEKRNTAPKRNAAPDQGQADSPQRDGAVSRSETASRRRNRLPGSIQADIRIHALENVE